MTSTDRIGAGAYFPREKRKNKKYERKSEGRVRDGEMSRHDNRGICAQYLYADGTYAILFSMIVKRLFFLAAVFL